MNLVKLIMAVVLALVAFNASAQAIADSNSANTTETTPKLPRLSASDLILRTLQLIKTSKSMSYITSDKFFYVYGVPESSDSEFGFSGEINKFLSYSVYVRGLYGSDKSNMFLMLEFQKYTEDLKDPYQGIDNEFCKINTHNVYQELDKLDYTYQQSNHTPNKRIYSNDNMVIELYSWYNSDQNDAELCIRWINISTKKSEEPELPLQYTETTVNIFKNNLIWFFNSVHSRADINEKNIKKKLGATLQPETRGIFHPGSIYYNGNRYSHQDQYHFFKTNEQWRFSIRLSFDLPPSKEPSMNFFISTNRLKSLTNNQCWLTLDEITKRLTEIGYEKRQLEDTSIFSKDNISFNIQTDPIIQTDSKRCVALISF